MFHLLKQALTHIKSIKKKFTIKSEIEWVLYSNTTSTVITPSSTFMSSTSKSSTPLPTPTGQNGSNLAGGAKIGIGNDIGVGVPVIGVISWGFGLNLHTFARLLVDAWKLPRQSWPELESVWQGWTEVF